MSDRLDIKPMSSEDMAKLKAAIESRWDEKPWYQGGGGLGSPGCMMRAEEILSLISAAEMHRATVEFVQAWAWRSDPPNASNKLTDAERFSAIKYYPSIKATAVASVEDTANAE